MAAYNPNRSLNKRITHFFEHLLHGLPHQALADVHRCSSPHSQLLRDTLRDRAIVEAKSEAYRWLSQMKDRDEPIPMPVYRTREQKKEFTIELLESCESDLTWRKVGACLLKESEASVALFKFWRAIADSNVPDTIQYWSVPSELRKPDGTYNAAVQVHLVRKIAETDRSISWRKIGRGLEKISEPPYSVMLFLQVLMDDYGEKTFQQMEGSENREEREKSRGNVQKRGERPLIVLRADSRKKPLETQMDGQHQSTPMPLRRTRAQLKEFTVELLESCESDLTWRKVGACLLKESEASVALFKFWRAIADSNVPDTIQYWSVPSELRKPDGTYNAAVQIHLVQKISQSDSSLSWRKVARGLEKISEPPYSVMFFVHALLGDYGGEPTRGPPTLQHRKPGKPRRGTISKMKEEELKLMQPKRKSESRLREMTGTENPTKIDTNLAESVARSGTEAEIDESTECPTNLTGTVAHNERTESRISDVSNSERSSVDSETKGATAIDPPSRPGPVLLSFVFDVSSPMRPQWRAIQKSVAAEIESARTIYNDDVLVSARTVGNRHDFICSYQNASFTLPHCIVDEAEECAIVDAIMLELDDLHTFEVRNPAFRSNIKVLVYTAGNDRGSRQDTAHLARSIAAVHKRGWEVQFMCSASRRLARRVGAEMVRGVDAVECDEGNSILERLEAYV